MTVVPVFAEPEELYDLVLDKTKQPGKDYAIVDVRDSDYIGGHIPGSINVPASQMYDKANDLIRDFSHVPKVYFHCALSQVRGPKSARIYSETMNNLGIESDQKVKILRNGFEGWHAKYRKEEGLIEDYDKSVWEYAIIEE
ncbi:hypothetical protein INT47_003610 [Mucor saturninus]|uniref:Rhodanese domain-containing protein n=1 Tax=Mucor saturninus TaxID=64648 RepID=A0A8H7QT05_9FUNG|nr:hypothetical protein INT47_003610 [Mucor saturninus]